LFEFHFHGRKRLDWIRGWIEILQPHRTKSFQTKPM